MKIPKDVWNQLKGITKDDLIRALEKDGWKTDIKKKSGIRIYRKGPGQRVSVHYHPHTTFKSAKLLKSLLDDIGWTEKEMRKLKLIK